MDVLYDPPWMRIGPYLVGMIAAYILMRLKQKLIINRKTLWLLWIIGSSSNLIILFGLSDKNISITTAAIYNALSRPVWGIGISWLLIACITNHGGFINKFLSLTIWIPVSRLTYCAYLLNPYIITSLYRSSETAMHVDVFPNVSINTTMI